MQGVIGKILFYSIHLAQILPKSSGFVNPIRSRTHGRRTFFVLNYPLVHLPDFFGFVYIVCLKLYSKQTLFPDFSENKMFFNSACSAQDTDIPCPSRTFFACFSGPSLHSFPVSTGSGLYDGSGSCFLPHSLNASCNCLR